MKIASVLPLALCLFLPLANAARASDASDKLDAELIDASKAVSAGHVTVGLNQLREILSQTSASSDRLLYRKVAATYLDFLAQIEDTGTETQVLNQWLVAEGNDSDNSVRLWLQYFIGRNSFQQHKYDDAEKFLRALTGGGSNRITLLPPQRSAAILLSKIELERNNISQSAIWMRLAMISLYCDTGAGSEEIIDDLTEYGSFLIQTRRVAEAFALFARIGPFYEQFMNHYSPKYMKFHALQVGLFASIGNIQQFNVEYEKLAKVAGNVDVVPTSVKAVLWYDGLYKQALSTESAEQSELRGKLESLETNFPVFAKDRNVRIALSYFSLVSNNVELADHFLSENFVDDPADLRNLGYRSGLMALIAAHQSQFDKSIELAGKSLSEIENYHAMYQTESSTRLPGITIEERQVLSAVLLLDLPHATTYEQRNIIFQLAQFINRDKGRIGITENVRRRTNFSQLGREDIRTQDRLRELRDKLIDDATNKLIDRIVPIHPGQVVPNQDFSYLIRLEDIEDKIDSADQIINSTIASAGHQSLDEPLELAASQRLLKPNETLIVHNIMSGLGLVTQCIDKDQWNYRISILDKGEISQLTTDAKLLSAAVHNSNEPSAELDASVPYFPAESSYRLFKLFFAGTEACLSGKDHVLLATDADFFSMPWNALLINRPAAPDEFRFRSAAWLPRSFALSLLPSVRSLELVRQELPASAARKKFLGIGDPDFRGAGTASKDELKLSTLFTARGVANKEAIRTLPNLPEAAAELHSEAASLQAADSDLLLGADASEQSLRYRSLDDYRVISFATHGIVAGEIEGVTEPALVLSPSSDDTAGAEDGLLTTTKIANLSLDANLVILSACNTAASDGGTSGRGLSGLADSFFFAGARAVAVTQWAVFSSSAQRLATGLIANSAASAGRGVSAGLREAMIEYIDQAAEDYLANPRFWAAFIIAGDGAVGPLNAAPNRRPRTLV